MSETRFWQKVCKKTHPVINAFLKRYDRKYPKYRRDDLYDRLIEVLIDASLNCSGETDAVFTEGLK